MSHLKQIASNGIDRCRGGDVVVHPLNPHAKRKTLSLGDETGLTRVAVHVNIVAPGDETTETHVHEWVDEFVYIISGQATVYLDGEAHPVAAGDFVAFPARGQAHSMKNTGEVDLIYLVGGDRHDFDVCEYPRLEKRVYVSKRADGRHLHFVDVKNVTSVRRQ